MIPELTALGEKLGFATVLVPLALGALLTAMVFLAHSIAEWFDDRNL
jgi:hypothetical protein